MNQAVVRVVLIGPTRSESVGVSQEAARQRNRRCFVLSCSLIAGGLITTLGFPSFLDLGLFEVDFRLQSPCLDLQNH